MGLLFIVVCLMCMISVLLGSIMVYECLLLMMVIGFS